MFYEKMGLPVKRHTSSKRKRRRSHLAIDNLNLIKCSHCGNFVMPHRVCLECGFYKGSKVIDVLAKLDKKERKKKEKELSMKGESVEKGGKTKPLTAENLSKS